MTSSRRPAEQTHAPFAGFAPGVPHGLLRWIFAALAVTGLGLTRVVQRSIRGNAALPLLGRLTNAAIVGLALCEAIAVYGFVLFMLAGRPIDYYGFAALALVGFLPVFPAPWDLGRAGAHDDEWRRRARNHAAGGVTARLRSFTLAERPDLAKGVHRLIASLWPPEMEYIHHDPVCGRHWGALYRQFAEFQPVLCDARAP